ncbi:hypothetical protein C900_05543 [Fulvivirga imtechensis AK7]|uniref:Uncharacterized protein n=1 Tax=Fulvivirga imtechensis AK7 TaxID=1237149 RepID=L8JJK5_9BACT|nr:hypothetical protein C900_05543 [Fulvivirga imtechensis AK7]
MQECGAFLISEHIDFGSLDKMIYGKQQAFLFLLGQAVDIDKPLQHFFDP